MTKLFTAAMGNKRFFVTVDRVVKWLESSDCDRHGLGSKPTRAILLCPWERHFTILTPAWWSGQAVPNFRHIFPKLKNQNKKFRLLAFLEAGWSDCLRVAQCIAPSALSYESKV